MQPVGNAVPWRLWIQARLDVLDVEVEATAAQLVDIERDANEALGAW